jgi:hypothetical protein
MLSLKATRAGSDRCQYPQCRKLLDFEKNCTPGLPCPVTAEFQRLHEDKENLRVYQLGKRIRDSFERDRSISPPSVEVARMSLRPIDITQALR